MSFSLMVHSSGLWAPSTVHPVQEVTRNTSHRTNSVGDQLDSHYDVLLKVLLHSRQHTHTHGPSTSPSSLSPSLSVPHA
jgi:hypothetical protein